MDTRNPTYTNGLPGRDWDVLGTEMNESVVSEMEKDAVALIHYAEERERNKQETLFYESWAFKPQLMVFGDPETEQANQIVGKMRSSQSWVLQALAAYVTVIRLNLLYMMLGVIREMTGEAVADSSVTLAEQMETYNVRRAENEEEDEILEMLASMTAIKAGDSSVGDLSRFRMKNENSDQEENEEEQAASLLLPTLSGVLLKRLRERSAKLSRLLDSSACTDYDFGSGKMASSRGGHTVGVKSDGTVVTSGKNTKGQCNISKWEDIVAVSTGKSHTVGLKSDGTVVATGENKDGQCNVSSWRNIVAISAGYGHTVGLKSDGTVVATGHNLHNQCNVTGWRDITAICCGSFATLGLKKDGTVVQVGFNSNFHPEIARELSRWKNIVAVSVQSEHAVGLKSDGTVLAVGYNKGGQCNVSDWKDIISVACGGFYTVGLKSDGTVVSAGELYDQDMTGWSDVAAIVCYDFLTMGIRSDGTILATANKSLDIKSDVAGWKLFDDPDNLEEERKAKKAEQQRLKEEEIQRKKEEKERKKREKQLREQEEARRQEKAERVRKERERIYEDRRRSGVCQYCGGEFKGLFRKVCTVCGERKNY